MNDALAQLPTAVNVQHVSKRFKRRTDRRNSLKERIVRGRSRGGEDFWAVRDVTLQIPGGSVFGLIGHNGSGKSTLLKMIGGIYRPTEGTITTQGRLHIDERTVIAGISRASDII